jgi:hypothetical protein
MGGEVPVRQPVARRSGVTAGYRAGADAVGAGGAEPGTGIPDSPRITVETGSRLRQGSICLDLNERTSAMNRFMFCYGVSPGSRCTLMPSSAGPGSFRSAA